MFIMKNNCVAAPLGSPSVLFLMSMRVSIENSSGKGGERSQLRATILHNAEERFAECLSPLGGGYFSKALNQENTCKLQWRKESRGAMWAALIFCLVLTSVSVLGDNHE
jgi:hypothetical protein